MITGHSTITNFLGLLTHLDETNIPLGGALICQNYAQYFPMRIQRIPGLTNDGEINDSEHGFLHAWRVRVDGGDEKLMAIIKKSDDTVKVWNLTDDEEVTGDTTLTDEVSGLLAGVWTSTYYLRQQYVGNGSQAIQVITAAGTRTDAVNTTAGHGGEDMVPWIPPVGSLLQAYLGRLYVAGIDTPYDDQVWYSDSLTTDFEPLNFLNADEVPGKVTALAVNSATSANTGILGELIIAKATGLIKLHGDPTATDTTKDVVSSVVGSVCPHTFVNTPVGLIFMGQSANQNSVYFLPTGSVGEPVDIGLGLNGYLNNLDVPLSTISASTAVYHDGMYKLFVNYDGTKIELWADIRGYIRDQIIRWYGPHTRGANQAPVVAEAGTLYMFENNSGTGYQFHENTTKSTEFYDLTHSILSAILDIPLNVPPIMAAGNPTVSPVEPSTLDGIDKSYDLFNVYFSKEVNVVGNEIAYRVYSEGVELGGVTTTTLRRSQSLVGVDKHIPIVGTNGASFFTRYTVRVQLNHLLDFRSDITKMGVQYLYDEQQTHKASPNG